MKLRFKRTSLVKCLRNKIGNKDVALCQYLWGRLEDWENICRIKWCWMLQIHLWDTDVLGYWENWRKKV